MECPGKNCEVDRELNAGRPGRRKPGLQHVMITGRRKRDCSM